MKILIKLGGTLLDSPEPGASAGQILDAYEQKYSGEPAARTNFADIGFKFDPGTSRSVVVSVIDNLVKGAAGQAVQNMNLLLGFPESEALR